MTRSLQDYGSGYQLVDDKDVDDNVIIPDDSWALKIEDSIIGINFIKFADEENPDGSYNVNIDYDVLEGTPPADIDAIIGEIVMNILEDSIELKEGQERLSEYGKGDE